jgi:RimJ/RimL family protein N-acetyltransferase
VLRAIEPTPDEVRTHAAMLADWYNHPQNAALMGHDEALDPDEVIEHYADMAAEGARVFLLFRDGELAGDGDLRHFDGGGAEFAFMIGAPSAQGKGLGTRFALMIAAIGFSELGLATIFASVVPHNTASRRVFEKLGYVLDDSPRARTFADEPEDLVLAIDRATLERTNAATLAEITVQRRYTT